MTNTLQKYRTRNIKKKTSKVSKDLILQITGGIEWPVLDLELAIQDIFF